MWNLGQIKSQVRQLLLFYNSFSIQRIIRDCLLFPLDYCNSLGKARFLWAIDFLVTSACNLNCHMCSFKPLIESGSNNILDINEIRDFLKREHKKKFHVFLSGGEPFMRKDIFEIIEAIRQFSLSWGVCTNGTLLDEAKIKRLIKFDAKYIIFSLHGPEKVHDEVTAIEGSFRKLLNNVTIASLLRNKTKIIINCTVSALNMEHLGDVVRIAEEVKADVLRFEHLNFLTPNEISAHNKVFQREFAGEKMTLSSHFENGSIKNWKGFCRNIEKMNEEIRKSKIPVYFKPFLNSSEIESWYSDNFTIKRKCLLSWNTLSISPSGDIMPCHFLIYKLGNIKTDRLEDIWNGEKYRNLRLRLKKGLLPGCSRCCKL